MTATRIDTFTPATVWTDVCAFDDLLPGRGVCALVGRTQVAVFRMPGTDALYAVSNYDPFSNVIDVYVQRLRRKLDRPGAESIIRTRRGEGYQLEGVGP